MLKKKIPFIFFVMIMLSVICGLSAAAHALATPEGLVFDPATGMITDYTGTEKVLAIPSEIDGVKVTGIDDFAFSECSNLTSIEIPDGVKSIGHNAFYECFGLVDINIPDSVVGIGEWAFYRCTGLTGITIPYGVISIGSRTFYECRSLESITISGNVTEIGDYAFNGCTSLKSVTMSNNVKKICDYAFYGCTNLAKVNIPDSLEGLGVDVFTSTPWLGNITGDLVTAGNRNQVLIQYKGS